MATRVKTLYSSLFRNITGKAEEVVYLETPVVKELIDHLSRLYGQKFRELVIDPQTGEFSLTGGVYVSVGGRRVGMNDKLSDGDEIAFLMAMAGGRR
jgi:molybdopterin converting factor small subunit